MKKTFLMTVLTALTLTVSAQECSKMTMDARVLMADMHRQPAAARSVSVNANDGLYVIMTIDEAVAGETIEQLKSAGITLHGRLGDQLAGFVPFKALNAVERINGVTRIGTAGPAPKPMTDVTRPEVLVSDIDGTKGIVGDVPMTGKGVIAAIIDIGFDFNHPAFKDSEGRTRIKAYYSPFDNGGSKVVVDGIELPGSVYSTPEQIEKLTTDLPGIGHGSHTAGIEAGTRLLNGWGGMAPDADIVLCAYMGTEEPTMTSLDQVPTVFDALVFLKDYATKAGKPMSVNMSIGGVYGPHNGKEEMCRAINAFTGPGRLVAISSANSGMDKISLMKTFASDKDTLRTIVDGNETRMMGATQKIGPLSMRISIVKGVNLLEESSAANDYTPKYETWETLWQSPVLTAADDLSIITSTDNEQFAKYCSGTMVAGVANDEEMGITKLIYHNQGYMNDNDYHVELTVWSEEGMQLGCFNGNFKSYRRDDCTDGMAEMSTNSWASAVNTIAVGNYCANLENRGLYTAFEKPDDEVFVLGDIAPSSSWGVDMSGRQIPTVTAPGSHVVSSVSRFGLRTDEEGNPLEVKSSMTYNGFYYDSYSGTSMATPCVAGIMALWLQADPTLSPDDVVEILQQSSRTDQYTQASPGKFGFGKIDAKRGLELVLERKATAIRTVDGEQRDADVIYDLQGRRLNSNPKRGLYIKGRKKVLF